MCAAAASAADSSATTQLPPSPSANARIKQQQQLPPQLNEFYADENDDSFGDNSVKILRSPSRDSVATNLSLLSLSSYGSGMSKSTVTGGGCDGSQIVVLPTVNVKSNNSCNNRLLTTSVGSTGQSSSNGNNIYDVVDIEEELEDDDSTRGPSPNPDSMGGGYGNLTAGGRGQQHGNRNNLQVPSEHYGFFGSGGRNKGLISLSETLFEEESDLIRSCGALSSVLGVRRSFSTSDISQAASGDSDLLKPSASEVVLCGSGGAGARDDLSTHGCLDYSSRSCSTWVAVGDMASTSQLPSPQGNPGQVSDTPTITAAEFVRSVNKKVRQTYIKRRLLATYKALERIAQSELNLQSCSKCDLAFMGRVSKSQVSREILKLLRKDFDPHGPGLLGAAKSLSLTVKDVENEKGKPLTKYERNMMIFNWLHTLDDNSTYDRLA